MTATWIADALRAGGCLVDETVVPDWRTRGHTDGPTMPNVVGVMGHHTAGNATGNLPSLRTVRDGRGLQYPPGDARRLDGPLANLMLARDGTWVPIAAGRCWHAGAADKPAAWPWIPGGDANGYVLGVEAESTGLSDDWTPAQRTAYPQGVAALLRHQGLTEARFLGHKEWAPSRKSDPAFWDMAQFRATVATFLRPEPDVNLTDQIPNANPDTKAKVPTTTVGNLLQDVQANAAFAARQTMGLSAQNAALTAAVGALSQLVAQQNGLTADQVRAVVAEAVAAGVAVHVDVQPSS